MAPPWSKRRRLMTLGFAAFGLIIDLLLAARAGLR
jgi:hypothetical protein